MRLIKAAVFACEFVSAPAMAETHAGPLGAVFCETLPSFRSLIAAMLARDEEAAAHLDDCTFLKAGVHVGERLHVEQRPGRRPAAGAVMRPIRVLAGRRHRGPDRPRPSGAPLPGRRKGNVADIREWAGGVWPHVHEVRVAGAFTLQEIADALNERGIPAFMGGR